MNFYLFGAEGCILLLLSVISLVIFLKRYLKQQSGTTLRVMVFSDLFYCIVMAVILLAQHIEMNLRPKNNANISVQDYNSTDNQIKRNINKFDVDSMKVMENNSGKCDVIMQYAILIIPFTNTFISILTLSVYCNLKIRHIKSECTNLSELESSCDNLENVSLKSIGTNKLFLLPQFKKFKLNKSKIMGLFILCEWILPIFATGALYAGSDFHKNNANYTEDTQCILDNNFLFQECFYCTQENGNSLSEAQLMLTQKDYVTSDDLLSGSSMNNAEVNTILSKIHSIIHSSLINAHVKPTDFYTNSDPTNITKVLGTNANRIEEKENSDAAVSAKNVSMFNLDLYKENVSISDSIGNSTNSYKSEQVLVPETLLNSAVTVNEISNTTQTKQHGINMYHLQNPMQKDTVTNKTTTGLKSEQDIYANILKRIHGSVIKTVHANMYNKSKRYRSNQFNQYHTIHEDALYNINRTQTELVFDKCLLSVEFLKSYVLILMSLVYFLPILLCSILQTWGKVLCKVVEERLRPKKRSSTLIDKVENTDKSGCSDNSNIEEPVIRVTNKDTIQDSPISEVTTYLKEERHLKLRQQVERMIKTFNIVKISLVLGTLLWLPILLQIFLQVFFCMQGPIWMSHVTYISGISFGVIRNIFNIYILQLRSNCPGSTKTNSIHPS